jgi:hypothetical protein
VAEKRQKVLFVILGVLVVVFLARMLMGGGGGGGGGSESESTGRERRTEEASTVTFGDTSEESTPAAPSDPRALDYPPARNPFAPVVAGAPSSDS